VTTHPFEDGNGRIARAITDMALARSENSTQRFYSMSAQIRLERNAYYSMLEKARKGGLDVTPWLEWFLGCLDRAFDDAEHILAGISRLSIVNRQLSIFNRLTLAHILDLTKTGHPPRMRQKFTSDLKRLLALWHE